MAELCIAQPFAGSSRVTSPFGGLVLHTAHEIMARMILRTRIAYLLRYPRSQLQLISWNTGKGMSGVGITANTRQYANPAGSGQIVLVELLQQR